MTCRLLVSEEVKGMLLKSQRSLVYILVPMKPRILVQTSWFVILSNLGNSEILWVGICR